MTGDLRPLGRLVRHDPRSRAYAFRADRTARLGSVRHESHIGVLDQGDLGSCTGNATVGALGRDPFFDAIPHNVSLDEDLAVKIYSAATRLDDVSGTYPPTDTGSSGLGAAKAAQQLGYINGYTHAFTLNDALVALQSSPFITGVSWYSSFDTPDANGLVAISHNAYVRGGHEFVADEFDADKGLIWFCNSWGTGWGNQGRFCMTTATFAQLLADQGDVTVFTPLTSPPPLPDKPPVEHTQAEVDLAAAITAWEKNIISKFGKAAALKRAGDAWKAEKGL